MLTHIDSENRPTMVNVGHKDPSIRQAIAEAIVVFPSEVVPDFNDHEIRSPKGPVFATAIIAGTMAVKSTSNLIPFCHPLIIDHIHIDIQWLDSQARIRCSVSCQGRTGVEMEALTGASVAALTIIDMCKALSPALQITQTRLLEKTGGKNDYRASSF